MIKFNHMNLPVVNLEASRDWYTRNFGFKVEFEIPERRTTALVDDADFTIFITEVSDALAGLKPDLSFQVDDVEQKFRELREDSVQFVSPPGCIPKTVAMITKSIGISTLHPLPSKQPICSVTKGPVACPITK